MKQGVGKREERNKEWRMERSRGKGRKRWLWTNGMEEEEFRRDNERGRRRRKREEGGGP